MSEFWIIMIAIGYIIVAGVVFGIVYAITGDDLEASSCGVFWIVLPIIIPVVLLSYLVYILVKSIKNKRNEL